MLLRHNRNIDIRWQPALAGIRVMLHQIFNVLSIGIRPALAGIRVMSNMKDIMKVTNRGACISRYSCNVKAEAYLLLLSASLIKSCEAYFN